MTMNPEESIDSDWTERELLVLRSAALDTPPRGADDRTLVALGLAAAGVGAGAGVGTATVMKAAGQAPIWLKWASVALLGGGVAGAILFAKHRTISSVPEATPAAAPSPAPMRGAAPIAAAPSLEAAAPAAVPSTIDVADLPKEADASERRDVTKRSLSDEIRLIDEARTRLRGGDARGALEVLDRYDLLVRRAGSMRAEAAVVRIEALQASGAGDRARSLGERFLAMNPTSPYADYVRRLLARGD